MQQEPDMCCGVPAMLIACDAAMSDAASYRDVCTALRQEHDREVAISQQLMVSGRRQPPGLTLGVQEQCGSCVVLCCPQASGSFHCVDCV